MGICESESKKNPYICQKGHPLEWQGAKYIFNENMVCDGCGKYSNINHPIRWKCSKCNLYFCSICYDIIISETCPVNHPFKLLRNDPISYVCDKCYGSFPKFSSKFKDDYCNLTYCLECFYEHINYSMQNKK